MKTDGLKELINKYFYIFISLFYALVFNLFYYKTRNAGFVFDVTEWLKDYIDDPNFNYFKPPFDNNFRPVYHFILNKTFLLFDVNPKAWYILSLGLFYIACVLFAIFIDRLYALFHLKNARLLAFITSFFVVVSPFNTEIIVWYATIHYSIVFICLFSLLILMLKWRNKLNFLLLPNIILFSISILSIELSYSIMPISWLLFFLLKYFNKSNSSYKDFFKFILMPQLVIFISFLTNNMLNHDKMLGHYHMSKVDFNIFHLIVHWLKLYIKFGFLPNFFGQKFYEPLFNLIDKWEILFAALTIGASLFIFRFIYINRKEMKKEDGLVLFLIAASFCFYIPISFLFFHNFKEIELDRLGVGVFLFGISWLLILVFRIRNEFIKHFILISYFILSVLMLQDYTTRWENSKIVRKGFVENLPIYENKDVYVIATPILFKYAYLFAINDSMEIHRYIKIFKKIKTTSTYNIVGFYNMTDIDDMVSVTKVDSMTLNVELKKWGNWCWKNLRTAIEPKETSKYILTPADDHLSYKIRFKSTDSNDKVILFNRLNFHEVDWINKPVGTIFL